MMIRPFIFLGMLLVDFLDLRLASFDLFGHIFFGLTLVAKVPFAVVISWIHDPLPKQTHE
ncbi:hypothetical protein D3C71_1208070 [compost metagenome]